ncbi:MAG: polysaccharide deacetylase family protein [Sphingobacteriales bacterium]|jgi:peptidoglycan/xylan/chitin deacetylase (PgdA/CDA1 family)|nr:polysaccharide deacetylase family protein [Sphingobacteriales bacterium]OJW32773.1 MAG: polysaccharide deacetylase family protein [Sphingobacteriales bacterium 46-32]
MKNYFIKTPWWLKRIYPAYRWSMPAKDKVIYLTFDDGPHAVATPFVLDELKKHQAQATFFCIGKNVQAEPALYRRILDEGHVTGNHTQHHLNGWKTSSKAYLEDVAEAAQHIDSRFFRPPYGRITRFQASQIAKVLHRPDAEVVMWDVLSADFDESLSGEQCLQHVVMNTKPGSIIVFHDSQKALPRLQYCLPLALEFFKKNGFEMKTMQWNAKEETKEEK